MNKPELSLTPEQEAAVKHRGGALLVSAAAGSGKTKVLVERLLSRVGEGDNIDEFLVITYTRAAAAELRERIYDEILERLAGDPENRRLRRQSMLCRGAPIGTIHSFCTDILRENAHLAGLPSDFRVADESEGDMIKAEVLEDVLDEMYERIGGSDFRELVDMVSAGRDDKRLVRIILKAHAKLQSSPNPRLWADEQIERLSMTGVEDVSETVWGRELLDKARETVKYWHNEMAELSSEAKTLPDFDKAYGNSIEASLNGIGGFLRAIDSGWDEARRFREIDFPGAKPIKGYEDLKETRLRCKAAMKKLAVAFECSSGEHIEDLRAIAPAMTVLFNLILDFDRAYTEEKRRRGVVDFSDLEHLTLSMLVDGVTGERTGLARATSRRFKEIMVDEYQDVNAVQEMIFNAVSQDGRNVFMVGDVKQSIYRFRLADPSIFLEKYRRFNESKVQVADNEPPTGDGVKIHLSKNFRSRAEILEAVNFVFERIMSREFGEMDYTEHEMLVAGREGETVDDTTEPSPCVPCVEFDIVDMSGSEQGEDEDSPGRTQAEARFVTNRIAELTSGDALIPDGKGALRRVEYSDIVILLRTMRDKAWVYAAALAEQGIPVDMPGGEGYFETVEVSAALSLLSVIDNPMQDIPLASALRGPVYGFTDDELAEIRAGSRNSDFYGALVRASETNEKCAAFLSDMEAFRVVAPDMSADRFIWHMYNKTRLPEIVGDMRGGDRRRSNLILLAESAQGFEQSGYKGLFGFLTYIRGLQARGSELNRSSNSPSASSSDQNAVRIMSIHKSKGLEFPVVFLSDTAKLLNNKDAQQSLVLHPALGAGPMRTDKVRRIEYTTLARMAIQSRLTSEMMAEELRVLYVAMTRAREILIITASYKNAEKEIGKIKLICGQKSGAAGSSENKIAPQALEDIRSMAGWVLAAGVEFGIRNSEFGIKNVDVVVKVSDVGNENSERSDEVATADADVNAERGVQNAVCEEQNAELRGWGADEPLFSYPYALAPDLPSKLTVTGLKGRNIDVDSEAEVMFREQADTEGSVEAQTQGLGLKTPGKRRGSAFSRPSFIQRKTGLTAAERGIALHMALQHVDYRNCGSFEGVNGELSRLNDEGVLTSEQVSAVDASKLSCFFESDIGARVRSAYAHGENNVRREFKFSLMYPAERFYGGGGDDEILLQGVVDCFFEEGGELTVVDFKTDHVTPESVGEKLEYYSPQLHAYSEALERITGKKVKERVVYFFALNDSFAL